ncbi:AAA family ATPase [Actinoplanes sp. NPDC049802]|uniref:ATP-binding protein n=1 Tax=Actinoplanes sp. NPDC049802 TaxID=3154742 RepID=UPI0033D8A1B7
MTRRLWGREAELSALTGGIATATAGPGGLIAVEGPAGIGKTALLDAVATGSPGRIVLRARGNPIEQDFPYGVARQAFAPLLGGPDWADACRGPAGHAARVLGADPSDAPTLGTGPAGVGHTVEAMHAATHALFWLTAHLAARAPVVLCVDDAHWADPPSLRWLVALSRRIDAFPAVTVLAIRSGEPAADPMLLGELLSAATTAPIRPGPLDRIATAELIREILPSATGELIRDCHAAAGGNPFLIRMLAEDDRTTPSTGTAGIARWVEQRLRRLPSGATGLAHALALLGPGATQRHAANLAGITPEQAAVLSDAMRAAGLLQPDGAPCLAHPIVAAALHDGMGPGIRALWHARAARLLATGTGAPKQTVREPAASNRTTRGPAAPERTTREPATPEQAAREPGDPERAALHLLHAEPAGDAFAVAVLRAAARHATARGAPEAAATFLRRALDEPSGDPAIRLELSLALAAGRQSGVPGLAREVVAGITDAADRADAALRCGRALALAGDLSAADGLYRLVLDRPAGVPVETLARLEAEQAAVSVPDSRNRRTRTPSAGGDVPSPQTPRPETGAAARAGGGPQLWRVHAVAEATFAGRPPAECLALLAPVLDDGTLAAETDSLLPTVAAIMLIASGELDRARSISDTMIAGALERGWMSAVAHGRFLRALTLLPAAAVRDAAVESRAALDFKLTTGTTPAAALLWALVPLVESLTEAGRPAEAEAAIDAAGIGEPPPYALTAPMFLQVRARLRLGRDRPAEALADLLEAADRWAAFPVAHPVLASWPADAVRAYLATGRAGDARRTAATYLESAERTGVPDALGGALRAYALVVSGRRRIDLLERAVRVTAGTTARLQHTRALYDLGCALRRINQRTAARAPLAAALEIADAGGADRLAGLARAELRAAGARPRRAALHGVAALTDAERRVAGLAAHGLTNRQISDRLTLSRRTVETHLAHTYRKLAIRSRTELADALGQ